MSFTYILDKSNPKSLANIIKKLEQIAPTERYLITGKPYSEKRTELQNRLSHSWYGELAENLKEDNALGYKCFCKLHFGVPILRADDAEFREVYDTAIKPLSYEKKLQIMRVLPVTSEMNTKQLSLYLDLIKSHYYEHNGYELKFPMDYYKDMQK